MRTSYKRLMLLGAILLVLGLSMAGYAVVRSGGFAGLSNVTHAAQTAVFDGAEIRSITIDCQNTGITLLPSDSSEVTVAYTDIISRSGKLLRTFSLHLQTIDGELSIREQYTASPLMTLDFHSDPGLVVYVPRDLLDSLSITNENGSVSVSRIEIAASCSLRCTNGSIHLDHCCLADLTISTVNGSVTCRDTALQGCDISSQNGSVKLHLLGDAADYSIEAKSINGSIHAPECAAFAPQKLKLETVNGSITVEFS